jgi:hypothetical protein
MKRRSARNNKKNNPLAIELRDFLMYSNPSKFAPRIRQTGGEAFPQAPTMNQFFNYGAPTPKTPFVFQDGGAMNDIQKMNMQYMQHYGKMQDGGSSMDTGSQKSTRVADFLRKVKEKAMSTMEEELMNEASEYENELTNMFQYGGFAGPQPDFTKANAWMDAYSNNANIGKLQDNFLTLAEEWADTPDDVYVKKIKTKQMPIAQAGLNFRDQATLPFDYMNPPISRSSISPYPDNDQVYMPNVGFTPADIPSLGLTTQNPSYNQNILSENVPGAGTPIEVRSQYEINRNSLSPYPDNEYIPENPTDIQSQLDFRNKMRNISLIPEGEEEEYLPVPIDPNAAPQEIDKDYHKIVDNVPGEPVITPKGPTTLKTEDDSKKESIVEKTIDDIAKKREEEAAARKEGTKEGTSTNAGAPAAGSEQEKKEAAAAGMTPAEYRTFLSRMSINKRRALLPGNRAKSIDFYFDTYGPSGNTLGNTAGSQSADPAESTGERDSIFNRAARNNRDINYTERGNPMSVGEMKSQKEQIPMKSVYDPRGYNNAYSELRNQSFQNRRRNLGSRIDELYQREGNLGEQYGQGLTRRESNKLDRLENRYNRIGSGRPAPGMTGPSEAETFSQYMRPEYIKEYGGLIQYQMGSEYEEDPFGTAGYSTDGYDTTEREDYAGNTIYEEAPEGANEDLELKSRTRVRQKLGSYNPYEAPTMLAGLNLIEGLTQNMGNEKKKKEVYNKMSADQVYTKNTKKDRGDYNDQGYFRLDQQVPVQFPGYNFTSPYARYGGSYKKGGEYYLSDEEIQEIINMGGQVEYLD